MEAANKREFEMICAHEDGNGWATPIKSRHHPFDEQNKMRYNKWCERIEINHIMRI